MSENQEKIQVPQEVAQQLQLLQARKQNLQLAIADLDSAIGLVLQGYIELIKKQSEKIE